MAALAILQPDARVEARLSSALSGAHRVLVRPTWNALVEAVERGDAEGCILDASQPDPPSALRRIAELRSRFPDLAIVACVDSSGSEECFDLGGMGVDGLVQFDDRAAGIRRSVDDAFTRSRALRVERALGGVLAAPGPRAVGWAVAHAGPETSVQRLAGALGHTPRTLRSALQAADLPGPARILLWGRLLLAAARLGEDGRRVEDVAFSLGYATTTSLARAMKIQTGLTPAEVSREGGLNAVIEALLPEERREASGSGGIRSLMQAMVSVLLAVSLGGCAAFGFGTPGVDRGALRDAIERPPIDQIHVGVLAVDGRTGRTLFRHNHRRKFVPASNQKILVTATALSLLGPDHRFRTEVWATGSVEDGSLDGDLVLVASGDPSLSDRFRESGTAALDGLADSVRLAGVEYVAGAAFVDVSAWDSTTVGPTWEVEDLRYAYGSTGGAFAIDEGSLRAVVEAGATVGSVASVAWQPLGTHDFVESRVVTVPADSATRIRPSYLPESRRIVLDGTVAHGSADTLSFATRDPVRQASAVWARALERVGVEVESGWEIGWRKGENVGRNCRSGSLDACPSAHRIAVLESPPLGELVAGILEPSQNWMTEQLVRTLGARFGEEGSWREGLDVIEDFLVEEVGIDSLDIAPRDGSGLSAYNLVTPRAIVGILRYMQMGPHADVYRSAMAEPVEDDSTLRRRLTDLEGRLFAKTGTISNVNSLSGYLVRENGSDVVFSVLTNGSGLPSSEVRSAIDDMVRILAR